MKNLISYYINLILDRKTTFCNKYIYNIFFNANEQRK